MLGSSIEMSGGRLTAYGSAYALASKPDLSQYPEALVYAGENEAAAALAEASESYHAQHYVRIEAVPQPNEPAVEAAVPSTGDHANLAGWFALAGLSLLGMAVLTRRRKEA